LFFIILLDNLWASEQGEYAPHQQQILWIGRGA